MTGVSLTYLANPIRKGFLVALILSATVVRGQSQPADYIVIDTTYTTGKVDILGWKEIRFQRTRKAPSIKYLATQIKEYGSSGEVYESFRFHDDNLFFRRLVNGSIQLYKGRGVFALKESNTLTFFNKKDYRTVISRYVSLPGDDPVLVRLPYSKTAMKSFIDCYNAGNCDTGDFPHHAFGLMAGIRYLLFNGTIQGSVPGSDPIRDQAAAPTVGLYAEFPFFRPVTHYLTTEVSWFSSKPVFFTQVGTDSYYFGLNVQGLTAQVNVKRRFVQKKMKPFAKGGFLITYMNIQSPTGLLTTYSYGSNGSNVIALKSDIPPSSGSLMGFNAGFGIEVPIGLRNNMLVEANYLTTFSQNINPFASLALSGFTITAGYNF